MLHGGGRENPESNAYAITQSDIARKRMLGHAQHNRLNALFEWSGGLRAETGVCSKVTLASCRSEPSRDWQLSRNSNYLRMSMLSRTHTPPLRFTLRI